NLKKSEDVRKWVVRRKISKKGGSKAPKIQRLITPERIHRKKYLEKKKIEKVKKTGQSLKAYKKLLSKYIKEEREVEQEKRKNGNYMVNHWNNVIQKYANCSRMMSMWG
ncbi:MAG: hypothetical protein EZS28_051808, partial [Streblomastix strix]